MTNDKACCLPRGQGPSRCPSCAWKRPYVVDQSLLWPVAHLLTVPPHLSHLVALPVLAAFSLPTEAHSGIPAVAGSPDTVELEGDLLD